MKSSFFLNKTIEIIGRIILVGANLRELMFDDFDKLDSLYFNVVNVW
jgi:hypothetical protein